MTTIRVLAANVASAEFVGIERIPCRFKTSFCPDRCGHGQDLAKFNIIEYESHCKHDEQGDEKKKIFTVNVNPNALKDKQDEAIIKQVKELKPGSKVRLYWEHVYVTETETGSKWPERVLRSLDAI
jgi:hypothetical protein